MYHLLMTGNAVVFLAMVGRVQVREGRAARLPGWLHADSPSTFGGWVPAFIPGALLTLRLPRLA